MKVRARRDAVKSRLHRLETAALAWLLLLWSATSQAQHWHGALAATTDYVFRGISQTQGDGAIQADLHYEGSGGWFAGAWASSIDSGYDTVGRVELDAYAGWNWQLARDWSARLAYVRYLYPDASGGIDYDYGDLSARAAWRDRIVGTVAWSADLVRFSQDGYAHRGNAWSYELALRQPFASRFAATVGAGFYDQLFSVEYWSWNAGLSCTLASFELDLAWFTNSGAGRDAYGTQAAGDRWAFTALWRF
jgi:uncharacterized protein (TIGR02001 family)